MTIDPATVTLVRVLPIESAHGVQPPSPELIELAEAVLIAACLELGIDRALGIQWHTGPITGHLDQPAAGGYDKSSPDTIHLSAALTSPAQVIEVVRHEVCHAAGFTPDRFGREAAEYACYYFGDGGRPFLIDGRPSLPLGPLGLAWLRQQQDRREDERPRA